MNLLFFKKKTNRPKTIPSLNKIQKLPRFQKGFFSFNKYTIEYVDALSLYYEFKDIFENRIYHFRSTSPQPKIIDAGGYIGISTLYFKSIYPNAKITVFEPDKNIFSILQRNIKQNDLTNITAVNAGLGEEDKIVNFFSDQADGGSIYNSSDMNHTKKIQLTKLSNYINQPVDLLKMNIEGAEGEVFEEIKEKLFLIKEIIFEYHAFYNLPQNLDKILRILDQSGFRYAVTDATSTKIPVPFQMPKNYKFFNLVYAKNTKY